MKIPMYVRVARDRYARDGQFRVEGGKRFNPDALTDTGNTPLPTVHVKLNLDVPDELLRPQPPTEIDVEIRPEDVGWTRIVEVQVPPEPDPELDPA